MPRLTVRPWIVSARMYRTETPSIYYPFDIRGEWSAVATYNDGTTRTLGTWSDVPTGYPRRGGSGRGAAYVACAVATGYNKPSDRECRQLFAIPGRTKYERPEGGASHPYRIPTGRERMRRMGIRPDVTTRPDMSARERYAVEYRKARLAQRVPNYGDAIVATGQAERNMPRKYGRYHGYDRTPWGSAVGGYTVRRSQRGKRDECRAYVPSPGAIALAYALEGGGRAKDRRWSESYRRHVAHLASWYDRLPNPATRVQHYGDRIADYQDGIRNIDGSYIYPLRRNA